MIRATVPMRQFEACTRCTTSGLRARGSGRRRLTGFTLVEAVAAIAIAGIVFAVVAVFLQRPVQGYLDTTRRAELSDTADVAMRRIVRDLRLALPNSVRVDGTGRYVEFLLVSGGGRYRAQTDSTGAGNVLDFTSASGDSSFDVIGTMPTVTAGNHVVIFNLGAGFSGADAYQSSGNNRATIVSASATTITLTAAKLFPYESPGRRFQIVEHAVTYECDLASGSLRRYWGYGINASQATPPTGGSSALLATKVTDCAFTYDANDLLTRYGTVSVRLAIAADGESANLHAEAHVANIP